MMQLNKHVYRLGIDIGSTTIKMALVRIEPAGTDGKERIDIVFRSYLLCQPVYSISEISITAYQDYLFYARSFSQHVS